MKMLTFTVLGVPQQKGSTKSFFRFDRKKGRPTTQLITQSDNPNLKSWEERVAFNAIAARNLQAASVLTGAVQVDVVFFLPRPKSKKAQRPRPTVAPDLDKLLRGVCDALSGILYDDDAQVVAVRARKEYAVTQPSAVISVWEVS